jgi:hypothetical protein
MTDQKATAVNLKPIIGCDGCEQYDGPDNDRGYLPENQRVGASEYTRFLVRWPDGVKQWSEPEQVVYCLGCEETAKHEGAKLLSLPDPEQRPGVFVMTRDEPDVMEKDGREQVARAMLRRLHELWEDDNVTMEEYEAAENEVLELMGVDL